MSQKWCFPVGRHVSCMKTEKPKQDVVYASYPGLSLNWRSSKTLQGARQSRKTFVFDMPYFNKRTTTPESALLAPSEPFSSPDDVALGVGSDGSSEQFCDRPDGSQVLRRVRWSFAFSLDFWGWSSDEGLLSSPGLRLVLHVVLALATLLCAWVGIG